MVRGRWVKHTYPGSLPLPERDPAPDNRWQRGHIVDDLYLADNDETAWAEWYRHLAERMIADTGLRASTPGRSSWRAFQRVGEQLWKDGWAGLIAPSAARPAGKVLCLFRNAQGVPGTQPVPPQAKSLNHHRLRSASRREAILRLSQRPIAQPRDA